MFVIHIIWIEKPNNRNFNCLPEITYLAKVKPGLKEPVSDFKTHALSGYSVHWLHSHSTHNLSLR